MQTQEIQMLINRASFIPSVAGSEEGTVEVTLRGETRRVRACFTAKYNWIHAYDIVGRYQTGGKSWPGSIQSAPARDSNGFVEHVNFGRDDRNPKFRKENMIWFK